MADVPHSPPRSSLYRLANDRLNGKLTERLVALRAEGLSWQGVAVALYEESGGMRISTETLRNWTPAEPEKASA